jgi:uncharacterized surface protein with fasciclin (FAS1) repeats
MRRARIIGAGLVVAAVAAAGAAGGPSAPAKPAKRNIVQTAVAAGQFKTLVALAKQAGLAGALSTGKLTVFAPTDRAFAQVPKKTLTQLKANPAKLRAVLLYHVVKGRVPAVKVVRLSSAKTLNGASVRIRVVGRKVFVNSARVVKADVMASNGVIHVIDKVLIPGNG